MLPTTPALPFLAPTFGSHMVLQRGKPNVFWGWTKPGEKVTVSIGGKQASGVAGSDGRWTARLTPPKVGGPYVVKIDGSQHVQLDDVLVGDVWLCTGQSNMEFGLTMAQGGPDEVAKANRPQIRLFMAGRAVAYAPKAAVSGVWKVCTPETVVQEGWGGFSAVGYFFGKRLQDELKVPIGLVEDCWGGTSAEAWTSAAGLTPLGDFASQLATVDRRRAEGDPVFGTYKNIWLDENDRGKREGWAAEGFDDSSWTTVDVPGGGNGVPSDGPGVVWYRRTVDVPQGGAATLFLNRIDETDTTWVNGVPLGTTSFDWAWRQYPVILKSGRNVVAVRVFTEGKKTPFLGEPASMYLALPDGRHVPLAGSWKTKTALDSAILSSRPRDSEPNPTVPTTLYNGMIAPVAPLAIRGAIWYQGETNAGRGAQYRRLLPAMIADWRRTFAQGDFPFYIVSLANFMPRDPQPGDDYWAELRDAQAHTATTVPNSGLAVTIDVGEANDVHPKDKRTVGERLALIALARTYGKHVESSGPTLQAMWPTGREARLTFDHAEGLTSKGILKGFAVAGDDRKWHWADARIEGSTVIVSSPDVPKPVAVRYAWGHNPEATLYNGAGLPAVPFRTDDWPLLSRDAK